MRLACAACALVTACGFNAGRSSGGDGGGDDDDGQQLVDTGATFGTSGGGVTMGDAQITAAGIEPDIFIGGGLHGISTVGIDLASLPDWAAITAAITMTTKRGEGVAIVPTDYAFGVPNGMGLGPADDSFQLVMDGEIALPGNMPLFHAYCDDRCFIQIASTPGPATADTMWLPPIIAASDTGNVTLPLAAAGWYPIRVAYADTGSQGHWQDFDVNNVAITGDQLRVRARGLQGLAATAFTHPGFIRPEPIEPLNAVHQVTGTVGPFDGTMTAATPSALPMYSLRWAGQLYSDGTRVDTQIRVDTGGGSTGNVYRLWLDHAIVADTITTDNPKAQTDKLPLPAGWHDVAVDLSVRFSPVSTIKFQWASRDVSLADIPLDVLRPALTTRFASYDGPATGVSTASMMTPPVIFDVDPSATVDWLDYGLATTGQPLGAGAQVQLAACGQSTTWTPAPATPAGWYYFDGEACPAPQNPPSVQVNPGSGVVTIYPFAAESYHGGAAHQPFAPSFTYVSAPFATPDAAAFGNVTVDAVLDGASLAIAVRTAADPTQLAAAAWTSVASGETPALAPLAYVQYQLVVASDGWHDPLIRKVTLSYTTR